AKFGRAKGKTSSIVNGECVPNEKWDLYKRFSLSSSWRRWLGARIIWRCYMTARQSNNVLGEAQP
ncbi:hypothetical protein E4U28_001627, partial [Claviceps purpurea]